LRLLKLSILTVNHKNRINWRFVSLGQYAPYHFLVVKKVSTKRFHTSNEQVDLKNGFMNQRRITQSHLAITCQLEIFFVGLQRTWRIYSCEERLLRGAHQNSNVQNTDTSSTIEFTIFTLQPEPEREHFVLKNLFPFLSP